MERGAVTSSYKARLAGLSTAMQSVSVTPLYLLTSIAPKKPVSRTSPIDPHKSNLSVLSGLVLLVTASVDSVIFRGESITIVVEVCCSSFKAKLPRPLRRILGRLLEIGLCC
jgi:hypothetical protein